MRWGSIYKYVYIFSQHVIACSEQVLHTNTLAYLCPTDWADYSSYSIFPGMAPVTSVFLEYGSIISHIKGKRKTQEKAFQEPVGRLESSELGPLRCTRLITRWPRYLSDFQSHLYPSHGRDPPDRVCCFPHLSVSTHRWELQQQKQVLPAKTTHGSCHHLTLVTWLLFFSLTWKCEISQTHQHAVYF